MATTGIKEFRHNYEPLPADVLVAIKPIYEDLSKDALLERCVGGFTQNNNESLNQLIWKIAPKNTNGSANIIEIAANVAACTFNNGNSALMAFLEEIGVALGPSSHEYVKLSDNERIYKADRQAETESKEARIHRRQEQQDFLDIASAAGTLLYGPGIDDSM